MSIHNMHPAHLNPTDLNQVQQLETELGLPVVAVEPDREYAQLDQEQLRKLQDMERRLGTVLLAYKSH